MTHSTGPTKSSPSSDGGRCRSRPQRPGARRLSSPASGSPPSSTSSTRPTMRRRAPARRPAGPAAGSRRAWRRRRPSSLGCGGLSPRNSKSGHRLMQKQLGWYVEFESRVTQGQRRRDQRVLRRVGRAAEGREQQGRRRDLELGLEAEARPADRAEHPVLGPAAHDEHGGRPAQERDDPAVSGLARVAGGPGWAGELSRPCSCNPYGEPLLRL